MKPLAALAALTLALAATVVPAFARDGYVVDDAHLLSADAVTRINQQVGDFHSQTGKEVVVVTTPSLDGQTAQTVAERDFAQQQVNGVMIFIAKQPKTIGLVPDRAASRFFPSGSLDTIRNAMRASFNAGNFDEGVLTGVGLTINMYRSHLNTAPGARQHSVATNGGTVVRQSTGGPGLGFIWWIIILAVIFFVIRGIFRAMSGPRSYGPGPGPGYGGPGYGGPGYGPGYGGGYGGGFGGGGFWSGLLGGLGGAWLGNEMFGNRGNTIVEPGTYAGMGDGGNAGDAAGWQSDAGQADIGNSSFGGFGGGDSGGGWGGGDSGGGWGGGDFGGGGGDSGGGW